jgi:protein gp37
MQPTEISWTNFSSNPIRAKFADRKGWQCVRVSEGCRNCYAATLNGRFGTKLDYTAANAKKVEFVLDEKELERWQKLPKDQAKNKVFVCDMTDIFQEDVPDWMIERVFQAMRTAPWWTFQVLTKRPKRMKISMSAFPQKYVPLNVWLGVSAENQSAANQRVPLLQATNAAVRFISYEPALGPVDFEPFLRDADEFPRVTGRIHLIIAGGESGSAARPAHPDWFRRVRDLCTARGVAFHFKQWGAFTPYAQDVLGNKGIHLDFYGHRRDVKGMAPFKVPDEWAYLIKVGAKNAGRFLDGAEWTETP